MIGVSSSTFNSPASFKSSPSLISVEDAKAYVDQLTKDLGMPSFQTVTVDPSGKIVMQDFDWFDSIKYFKKHYPQIYYPSPANDVGDDILLDLKIVLSPESSEIVCDYAILGAPKNDYSLTFQIEYLGYPTGSVTQ